jgi:hypothetical protein
MWTTYFIEYAVRERIRESLRIARQEHLAETAASGEGQRKLRGLSRVFAYLGQAIAARHGVEPTALRRA